MEQPLGFVAQGVWFGMQATSFFIWPETVSLHLSSI